jgi:putative ABC transport system permease protein
MIMQYLKIAFRNIRRHSAYSILNILGMATGLTCAILILLWVYDEWSYDRNFKNAGELFRVIENQHLQAGNGSMIVPTAGALASVLKSEYPEIIRATRSCPSPLTLKKGGEFIEEMVTSADKDFLKMFGVKFLQGDINTAFDNPHNIVMTEETAIKFFGTTAVLGKTIESRGYSVTVTGVVKNFPQNSHIQFKYLVPIEWMADFGAHTSDWNQRLNIYLELKKGTNVEILDKKIRNLIQRHNKDSKSEIFLQNIKKVHLFSSGKYIADDAATGNITYVRLMSLMATFILAIAFINFVNLSTALAANRAREVGVRKVTGANRPVLIAQFLGETLIIILIASIIATICVALLLPGFNNLTGKQLNINYQSPGLYAGILTIMLFCTFIAGGYPAFYLSSLRPLTVIRGIGNRTPGKTGFRRVLVVFQFFISILLIACTLIVKKQVYFLRSKDLGFNRHNITYFMFPTGPSDPRLESLKKELLKSPDILSVTRAGNPFYNDGVRNGYSWAGKKEGDDVYFHIMSADPDYANTYDLKMKSGRFFSSDYSSDKTAVVVNEEGANTMGFANPLGETITTSWGAKLIVIGIVKDFHIQSLHHKIEPLIMQLGESNNFYVRIKPGHIPAAVEYIMATFKSFDPGLPINFHFLDDDFENLYRTEQRMSKLSEYLSLLAIIISCLGLLGLSSFLIENRTKEVGIRKVNGAKTSEIFSLLTKEYIVLVTISFVIATPVAWFAIHRWLQNFAYRINEGLWVFAFTGFIALAVTLVTVGYQSFRAARRNPVEALRYE